MSERPPVRELIKEAVRAQGGIVSIDDIRRYILGRWTGVNQNTITAQTTVCTVNHRSRVHFPENSKVRKANDPRYDFLYRVSPGRVEMFDPSRHGDWEIARDADGRLVARRLDLLEGPVEVDNDISNGDANNDSQSLSVAPPQTLAFPLESHLRDFLAQNIAELRIDGGPLTLFMDEAGHDGVEYLTLIGPIDLLTVDAESNFVIFELKLGRGPDQAIGQLLRYMGWVKRELAGDRKVRGAIVARGIDKKLRYAAQIVPDILLFEYDVKFDLRVVN